MHRSRDIRLPKIELLKNGWRLKIGKPPTEMRGTEMRGTEMVVDATAENFGSDS